MSYQQLVNRVDALESRLDRIDKAHKAKTPEDDPSTANAKEAATVDSPQVEEDPKPAGKSSR